MCIDLGDVAVALLDCLELSAVGAEGGMGEWDLLEFVFFGLLVFAGFVGLAIKLLCCELWRK